MRRAFAYVNHGRWVADCPFGCGGAELAIEDRFLCHECRNAPNRHRSIPLVWPAPEDVSAIAAALVVRPVLNRNWNLNESIGALVAENAMHGLYDPETGAVAGDIGADQSRVPFLRSLEHLELTA
jgi:hypothetical protein